MRLYPLIICMLISLALSAQDLKGTWQFRRVGEHTWMNAVVPGNVYSDLQRAGIIPDPFYRDNEQKCRWVDTVTWEYRLLFDTDSITLSRNQADLVFDGLDTYAEVFLNGSFLLSANNMFRRWTVPVKKKLKRNRNELIVRFSPAQLVVDSIARTKLPLVYPDHNRVFARKAQFQFGWDWGPTLINAGIWKPVWIDAYDQLSGREKRQRALDQSYNSWQPDTRLIQEKDSIGRSFYFMKNGKPVYAKGANWIPVNALLTKATPADYRRLLRMARDANMNMLRVWGGGIYESDYFYDLCDELGIMVWQDFMFAGGMYPGDEAFMANVREEVRQQILRLRHHKCIVLWCGNNEIDEAWKNWGWQKQFGLSQSDSATLYQYYKALFQDSLRKWVNEFDGKRPYVSTSPMHGWGRKESLLEGDSHYWGVWWGLQDWEVFNEKTGRFVSEFGMQSMPGQRMLEVFTDSADRFLFSPVIRAHQKASGGFNKLNHYLNRYFIDSNRIQNLSLNEYIYLTQCLQYYVLKNSISLQRNKMPRNMGSLLWQLNDCWPVASWSIIDFNGVARGGWYGAKAAFETDHPLPVDSVLPKDLLLMKPTFDIRLIGKNQFIVQSDRPASFVWLDYPGRQIQFSDNYFNLRAGETKMIKCTTDRKITDADLNRIRVISLYDVLKK